MEVIGKIIHVLPEVSGTSSRGNTWKKREYVLETIESFPKKIFFDFFGERADMYPLNLNDTIRLSFDIESREYNGRWYTSVRGWKAEKTDASAAPQQPQGGFGAAPAGGFPTPGQAPGFGTPAAAPAPGFGAPAAPAQAPFPGNTAGDFPATAAPNDDLPF